MKDTVHLGDNIRCILDLKNIKQDVFAEKMGVSQAAISKLLATKDIDDERLKEVADKLGVSVRAIKRFDADAIMFFIENINAYDNATGSIARIDIYNINPLEEVTKLYERMLKEKSDEIEKLKQELGKK